MKLKNCKILYFSHFVKSKNWYLFMFFFFFYNPFTKIENSKQISENNNNTFKDVK